MKDIKCLIVEKGVNSKYTEVDIYLSLNRTSFDVNKIRAEANKAIKDNYGPRFKDSRLSCVVEAFDLKEVRIKAEVELKQLEDNLLQGAEVEQTKKEKVEKIEFIVRKDFSGNPSTISDLFDREMRLTFGDRYITSEVRNLIAEVVDNKNRRLVSFNYDLYLKSEVSIEGICLEGCHKIV